MTSYGRICHNYRQLILNGTYQPGDRLPSLRQMAAAGSHGINTVRSAMVLLEREGLVEIRERGGIYVGLRAGAFQSGPAGSPGLPPGAPGPFEALEQGRRLDSIMESLALANPGFAVAAPGDDLLPARRLQSLHAHLDPGWIRYADPAGEAGLRRVLNARYQSVNGPGRPEDYVVTNGATEALHLVISAFVRPGDCVVLESPTYFDYFRQLEAAGARILEVPLKTGGGLDLDQLATVLAREPVRLIICQPHVQNPSGNTMAPADKPRLVALARQHRCLLVQDDVYGDLSYGSERPRNLSFHDDYEGLLLISSISKSLAPGIRIGWIRSPAHARLLADLKLRTSGATNRPAQQVVAAFLDTPAWFRHLRDITARLQRRTAAYRALLARHLPPGSALSQPEGGCLLWIGLPQGTDATRLFINAAAEGILVAPGALFSANPWFQSCLRINTGQKLIPAREAALQRLCALL